MFGQRGAFLHPPARRPSSTAHRPHSLPMIRRCRVASALLPCHSLGDTSNAHARVTGMKLALTPKAFRCQSHSNVGCRAVEMSTSVRPITLACSSECIAPSSCAMMQHLTCMWAITPSSIYTTHRFCGQTPSAPRRRALCNRWSHLDCKDSGISSFFLPHCSIQREQKRLAADMPLSRSGEHKDSAAITPHIQMLRSIEFESSKSRNQSELSSTLSTLHKTRAGRSYEKDFFFER
jgi:hypothetical protein